MEKIFNVDNESAITDLRNGLGHDSRFGEEMTINRPPIVEDAIHHASNFARAEEERNIVSKKHGAKKFPQGISNHRDSQPQGSEHNTKWNGTPKKANAPPGFVFNVNDKDRAEGNNKNWTRDPDAYCEFHKSNGHATLNYETMRKALAEKFTKGELKGIYLGPLHNKKFFYSQPKGNPSPGKRRRSDDEETQPDSQTKPIIDCIIGGSELCREPINSTKAYLRKLKNTPLRLESEDQDEVLISFKIAKQMPNHAT